MLTQLGYTRVAEREADAHALRMLEQARISPKGTVDFFKRVEQLEKKAGAPEWDILRSHPQTAERAKRFDEQKILRRDASPVRGAMAGAEEHLRRRQTRAGDQDVASRH